MLVGGRTSRFPRAGNLDTQDARCRRAFELPWVPGLVGCAGDAGLSPLQWLDLR